MNAFLDHGEKHARKPRKPKRRPETELEKKQDEKAQLSKFYRLMVKEDRATCYALPLGKEAKALVRWAQRQMTLNDGDELIARVSEFTQASPQLRFRMLQDLDQAICNLRERSGLEVFDDPMPGEPDNVFLRLKSMLT